MNASEQHREELRRAYLQKDDVAFEAALLAALPESQELSVDDLTERFYAVREQRNALLWAAKKVKAGLDARIDEAVGAEGPSAVPVFDGLAELHAAIAKAEGKPPASDFGTEDCDIE